MAETHCSIPCHTISSRLMKVLFDHHDPFLLMHGGFQIQIEQSKAALEAIGVDVEYLRWWDDTQNGDIIHFFGRPILSYLNFSHKKGIRIVMSHLLTGLGSRAAWACHLQKIVMNFSKKLMPNIGAHLGWDSYRLADACVALTTHEAQLMNRMFGAPPEKLHIVPNGVEEVFLQSQPAIRGRWLVCTATITERKRIVELAEAAVQAQTPLWIVGKAYADSDPYAARFFQLAKEHPAILRFEGPIVDRSRMAGVYREARGFVLLSAMESLSLSALEAAAAECPLLLSDLPWARTVFKESVSYCPITSDTAQAAAVLRRFYDAAPSLKPPAKPLTWVEVAGQLKSVYESLLKTSR